MTPAERARHIERQEFEAERKAIRQRAHRHAEQCRRTEQAKVNSWLGRPAPESIGQWSAKPKQPKLYTHEGQTKTLSEWSFVAGVSRQTFAQRLLSMPFERAVTMAPRQRSQFHTVNGISKTLEQWADHADISYNALLARMRRGCTLAEAIATPARKWSKQAPPTDSAGITNSAKQRMECGW